MDILILYFLGGGGLIVDLIDIVWNEKGIV